MNRQFKKESGAALIVCLMLLVLMTLIGVSSITSSSLEEKMAGNIRNKHLSFQAAEAALRAGEGNAAGLNASDFPNNSSGLFNRSNHTDGNYPIWDNATYNAVQANSQYQLVPVPGTSQNAAYIIENFSTGPRDANCLLELPVQPGCLLPIFRITARGWGINSNASSTVQSTFKRL